MRAARLFLSGAMLATVIYGCAQRAGGRASTPSARVAVSDRKIYFSDYNWVINGSQYAQTNNAGAYCKFRFSGTSIGMLVNVGSLSAGRVDPEDYPIVRYTIDRRPFEDLRLAANSEKVMLAQALADGAHDILLYLKANDPLREADRWAVPTSVLRIDAFLLDAGARALPQILRPRRMIVYSDSVAEGTNVAGDGRPDASAAYPVYLGAALGAEYGVIAFDGQGWATSGYGGVPPLYGRAGRAASWDHLDAEHSRLARNLLKPAPDYVVVNLGLNDHLHHAADPSVRNSAAKWLRNIRLAAPRAKIFAVIPFGGDERAALQAAFEDYQRAAKDPASKLIDLGMELQKGLDHTGPSIRSWDGIHPSLSGQSEIGSRLTAAIESSLGPPAR